MILQCIFAAEERQVELSDVLPTSRLQITRFDTDDIRLVAFKKMCENIGMIVSKAKKFNYFISYAWPDNNSPLRSWFTAVHKYIELAGLDVFYDIAENSFTGRVPDIIKQLEARKVIVLFTPDYDFKCEKGVRYSLSEEAELVFSKAPSAQRKSKKPIHTPTTK